MNKIALVLVCLACAGHGRRFQTSPAAVQRSTIHGKADDVAPSLKLLAEFLLTCNPAAGFHPGANLAMWPHSVPAAASDNTLRDAPRDALFSPSVARSRMFAPPICSISSPSALDSKQQSNDGVSENEEPLEMPTPVPLSPWVALKGIFRWKSFKSFLAHVRQSQGDAIRLDLWPVLPPTYLLMGKAANRGVLSDLDPSLEQILQELINLLPVSARVPSEVDVELQKKVAGLFSNTGVVNDRLPSFKRLAEDIRRSWVQDVDSGIDGDASADSGLKVFLELSEYVLRADLEVLYGKRFTEQYGPRLVGCFGDWVSNIANGSPVGFFKELGEVLTVAISEMQQNPEAYQGERSVLQVYLNSGALKRHDDDAIIGLLSMTLMAAVFNTQVSLAWILVHLYSDPELLARAREEIASTPDLGDYSELSQLEFLNSCIDESVRLHTMLPGNIVLRKTRRDLHLGEDLVKEGSLLWLYPNAVHQDEKYFPQAGKFCPMRMLSGNLDRMSSSFELVTFGHGQKRCIGEKMARAMILIFLATILPTVDADAPNSLPEEDFFDLVPASRLRLHNLRGRDGDID